DLARTILGRKKLQYRPDGPDRFHNTGRQGIIPERNRRVAKESGCVPSDHSVVRCAVGWRRPYGDPGTEWNMRAIIRYRRHRLEGVLPCCLVVTCRAIQLAPIIKQPCLHK